MRFPCKTRTSSCKHIQNSLRSFFICKTSGRPLRFVLQTAFAPRFARCSCVFFVKQGLRPANTFRTRSARSSCVCAKNHKICFQASLKQILSFFGLFYKSSSIAVLLAYAVERASKKSVLTMLASAYWETHFMVSGSFSYPS